MTPKNGHPDDTMKPVKKVLVAIFLIAAFAILFVMLRSATPAIELPSPTASLGQATPITIHVHDAHGVRKAAAFLEQNGARFPVWEMNQPSKSADATWNFTAGIKTTPQLHDGKATLIVEATSNDMRGKTAHITRDVTVVSQPPTVSVDSDQHR